MLIDQVTIFVRAGKGGDGCMSFRREKFVPKGGPDGGDGGRGGDVVLVGDPGLDTLWSLSRRPHLRAGNGRPGRGKSMHGADADDRLVLVPLGTLVYDPDEPEARALADIRGQGDRFVLARGGRGGFGNEHFKSANNQTPREATAGDPAEERTLRLELKLIADVGLIGLPNAGKSTMLRAVSRATPKVADYPFTTLSPHLGIAELPGDGGHVGGDVSGAGERRLVFADIPGLIAGAADGAGLGHDFLRHIERTQLLVHLVDIDPGDGSDPVSNHRAIRRELAGYSLALTRKPEITVLNKIDLLPEPVRDPRIDALAGQLGLAPGALHVTSGVTGEGVRALLEECWSRLGKADRPAWSTGESG